MVNSADIMAKMIPPRWDDNTPNSERRVFGLLENDPGTVDWIVFHSLNLRRSGNRPYGEADFVALIPGGGVFCIEVKGGRVACTDGVWTTTDASDNTFRLKRSPFKQAEDALHELRSALEERLQRTPDFYKVAFGHVVIFTDVTAPPMDIGVEPWESIDVQGLKTPISAHLVRAVKKQRERLRIISSPPEPQPPLLKRIRDCLRPDFDRVLARSTVLHDCEYRLLKLTEEQYQILDVLGGNARCLFEGAAGTGKTLLALEFARRCAASGERVLLLCFNRLLGDWFAREIVTPEKGRSVKAGRFYKCLRDVIVSSPEAEEFLDAEKQNTDAVLFEEVYPMYGQLALGDASQKVDRIVVDEAQDLVRRPVLEVLDCWLQGGLKEGRWAFFGDFHRQAIYGPGSQAGALEVLESHCRSYARANLTQNCRNTKRIGEETALLSGFASPPYRMGQVDGMPVEYWYYTDAESQRSMLEKVLGQLAAEEGLDEKDVVILSRFRFEQSVASAVASSSSSFRIQPVGQPRIKSRIPIFSFATVQAFKGMESRIVVLCDVDEIERDEDRSLLYVAMSRARSLLAVLLHARTKGAVAEAFKKRLSDLWR
jgi:hypothetical protein